MSSSVISGPEARRILGQAAALLGSAEQVVSLRKDAAERARQRSAELRKIQASERLAEIPLERVREVTEGRLRLEPLRDAGIGSVADLLTWSPSRLERIDGVGPKTAIKVIAAARTISEAMEDDSPLRIDPDARDTESSRLLVAVKEYMHVRSTSESVVPICERAIAALTEQMVTARPARSPLRMLFVWGDRRLQVREAVRQVAVYLAEKGVSDNADRIDAALAATAHAPVPEPGLWRDFETNGSDYFTALAELGELDFDVEASNGHLPSEIVAQVERQKLDVAALAVSLRGYQAFGAKFALVQRATILGDEMGLGKTIEALAVMAHLHTMGEQHFLVVCPASVLVNWIQEVQRRSRLRAFHVHGQVRDRQLVRWGALGGVAVTTYDTLRTLASPPGVRLALLVADEAHYAKNPTTRRAETLRSWIPEDGRTLFLTGTPMENKVAEFRNLVAYLRPELVPSIRELDGLAGARTFRRAVAPVYLRRNQVDVLSELPPRLDAEDWVGLEGADHRSYVDAVAEGNFMSMRRAAFVPATTEGSAKLARLVDIVEESAAQGWKVVVFSFFLEVLEIVSRVVGEASLPPITGRVRPTERQAAVDRFTSTDRHAVLACQIQAGGVGLNIQAASVVILTEPQWKPSIEEQAIGRAHRMGQTRRVHVHRLLARDSVDERMLEILREKRSLFDEYVVRSELKEATPDAIDVSNVDIAADTASVAALERLIVERERSRLGLVPRYEVQGDAPPRPDA